MRMRLRPLLVTLGLWLASACAHADIYGYIDEQGSAHFSVEKLDDRYQLYMRGDQSFDSAQLTAPAKEGGQDAASGLRPALRQYLSDHPNLKKYEPLLHEAAKEFSLDPALLKAVMAAESGFNPVAVSPKGAVGLMQLMPATAERYGLQSDKKKSVAQKLTDPKINIRLGARYLRDLHRMFPNQPHLVLASYNAGEGAVQKYRNTIPPYAETQNYVKLVTQFQQLYKPPKAGNGASVPSGTASENRRVFMTIPGRRNLPPITSQ
ncbi:MAG: Lytic transglycosylase [Herminiimonas sp.]|nr:Lytic transglycosylase [Herminiimonas sp.]